MSDDFAFEPIRGIPATLPPGETLIWQGAPRFFEMACRVFHVRVVAAYFGALMAWRLASGLGDGASVGDLAVSLLLLAGLGAAAVAILLGIAWLVCRTTVYSVTSHRVFMRIGVALPITFNLPFKALSGASLKLFPSGAGNISLSIAGADRIAYVVLWPHARPWRFARAEPTLRFVPNAQVVAAQLAAAVTARVPETQIASGAEPVTGEPARLPGKGWPAAPAAA